MQTYSTTVQIVILTYLLHNYSYIMEAIKKQATKLREQVAKQQQAILRQLGHLGHETAEIDEAEAQYHEELQNLYKSTRVAKHFQKDLVRGVEGLLSTNKKQMELARRLAEDCCKYGIENQSDIFPLSRAALDFGTSHVSMEDHRETLLGILGYQVSEPLRATIRGAPLEDARHLTHQFDKVRQEFESQAADVIRRKSRCRDPTAEDVLKLKNAETRLTELRSSMMVLGKEATTAMTSVEEQQQQTTFQKLLTMVNAERSYHQNVVAVLEKLYSKMIEEELKDAPEQSETQQQEKPVLSPHNDTFSGTNVVANEGKHQVVVEELKDAPEQSETQQQEKPVLSPHNDTFSGTNVVANEGKHQVVVEELKDSPEHSETQKQEKPVVSPHNDTFSVTNVEADEDKLRFHYVNHGREHGGTALNRSDVQRDDEENQEYVLARVMHSFDAQEDSELSLAVGDCVVVRQVACNGWSEGECKGKAGWFPSAYVEMPDMDSESKLSEDFYMD